MQATLTWLDMTASDRDKMRRVLDLFKEQGTLDEMGLGSLRDVLSDALFPGTSYIHTRLRYVLFVPWIYQRLEACRVRSSDVERAARHAEVDLIGRLEQNEDAKGVIGVVARGALVRLPSSLYWGPLTRWGIFRPQQSQGWYHSHFDALVDGRGVVGRADDPGVIWSQDAHWHPRMPEPPKGFPGEASFAFIHEEADFLRGRVDESCSGTLLAWLFRNGSDSPAEDVWDDLEALLVLPLSVLAHTDGGLEELLADPLRLHQAIQHAGDRVHVFVDETGIGVPRSARPLYSMLESSVHAVRAPSRGAFQPKEWAARFAAKDETAEDLLRVAILSRNLTFDRSWDVALASAAPPGSGRRVSASRPLGGFLRELPQLPTSPNRVPQDVAERVEALADRIPDTQKPAGQRHHSVPARRRRGPRPRSSSSSYRASGRRCGARPPGSRTRWSASSGRNARSKALRRT